jgi:hypothetical protein
MRLALSLLTLTQCTVNVSVTVTVIVSASAGGTDQPQGAALENRTIPLRSAREVKIMMFREMAFREK